MNFQNSLKMEWIPQEYINCAKTEYSSDQHEQLFIATRWKFREKNK